MWVDLEKQEKEEKEKEERTVSPAAHRHNTAQPPANTNAYIGRSRP